MIELAVGDPVALTAPDLLLEDGAVVFAGEQGMVVGKQGIDRLVVSWGSVPPYRVGSCRVADVRRVQR